MTSDFTVVLLGNGTVQTFGINANGELGVNDTTQRNTPVQVFGISSSAVAVAGGMVHAAIVLADGTVRTYGGNGFGNLGVNDTTQRNTPVQVFGISSSATAVACGRYITAVLLANGTVQTFGYNNFGQLGLGDTTNRLTPVTVLNITSATAISCGGYHIAVLLANGTVRTFGRNGDGQLGVGDVTSRQTPVQVFGISSSAVAVACGYDNTSILLADGTVLKFGANYGNLGTNDTTSRQTPVQVVAISATVSVTPAPTAFLTSAATSITLAASGGQIWTSSATGVARTTAGSISGGGNYHTAVILTDGTVRTFGSNNLGQLGVGDTTTRLTPVQVSGIAGATAVACGLRNTAFLLADGTVKTCGSNQFSALGNNVAGSVTGVAFPVSVVNITSATAIAGGSMFHAVLLADGTVRTFGYNVLGALGINEVSGSPPSTRQTPVQVWGISSSAVAVACGSAFTVVLLANGTVRTFGENEYGQLGINESGGPTNRLTPVQVWGISSSATAISAKGNCTAVLLADGTVRTFGRNFAGQLGDNTTVGKPTPVQVWGISSSATAVACGFYHTAVLLADGTVRTFGYNNVGQLGVNDTTNRQTPVTVLNITSATAIACGYYNTIILLANGTVRIFGRNSEGQLGVNDTTSRQTPVSVFGALGSFYPTYVTAKGLALGLSAPTFQLDLSTDKARKLSTTTWTTGSDRRIKSDIQSANLARCVDIVDSLDLKYFKWDIPGVQGGQSPTDTHSLGWIAQEVKEFFPNSVRQTQDYGFDDFHNLDSDQLIKTMYGALKKMCSDTYGQ
jgi:alpha-tubulin suppressor-like RCC1 family protein